MPEARSGATEVRPRYRWYGVGKGSSDREGTIGRAYFDNNRLSL